MAEAHVDPLVIDDRSEAGATPDLVVRSAVCRDKRESYSGFIHAVRPLDDAPSSSSRRPVRRVTMELNEVRIMVIEDDLDARELMQAVLEQRGATVLAAESVARAFELLGTMPAPDVIISDIAMPEEDGLAFVSRLRKLPADRGGRIPTIAVSAYVASSDRTRALAAGFDRYLHKPVDFEELLKVIGSILPTPATA